MFIGTGIGQKQMEMNKRHKLAHAGVVQYNSEWANKKGKY